MSKVFDVNPLAKAATELEEKAMEEKSVQVLGELLEIYQRERCGPQAARTLKRIIALSERGLQEYGNNQGCSVLIRLPGTFTQEEIAKHKVLSFHDMDDFLKVRYAIVDIYLRQAEINAVEVDPDVIGIEPRIQQLMQGLAAQHGKAFRVYGENIVNDASIRSSGFHIPEYVNMRYPQQVSLIYGVAACNIGCKFCNLTQRTYHKELMTREILTAAVDGIDDEYGNRISLTPHTEPLLIKEYLNQIEYVAARKPNANVGFNTNGVLLGSDLAHQLVDSGAKHVHISLNMATREDYLWFTGKDYFEQVVRNIDNLLEIRANSKSQSQLKISVQLLKMPRNESYIDAFTKDWRSKLDGVMLRSISPDVGGDIDVDTDLSLSKKYIDFCKGYYSCYSMWTSLAVKWDGEIFPCCAIGNDKLRVADKHILRMGNVREVKLFDVWRGAEIRHARIAQSTGLLSPCRNCETYRQVDEVKLLELERQLESAWLN
jgi:MoaA/NifB/PqqE/SkfB family radical SAM enzyme